MKFPPDWSEFIGLLSAHGVRFIVVGAHALAAQPERMATLGNPPLRIDLMTSIDGVTFEQAWSGRLTAKLGDHDVAFLGLREFLQNKRAAGRAKDLAG